MAITRFRVRYDRSLAIARGSAVFSVLVVAGCQPAPPMLSAAERTDIAETITRLAASTDAQTDRAQCEASLEIFGNRQPVVASAGLTIRTAEKLESMCPTEPQTPGPFDILESDVHVLTRDVAYIVRQGINTPAGEPLRFASTSIFERVAGEWKLVHYHESFWPLEGS